ncbi:MAG: DMT family transporter [Pikeienuella sp.]
MTRAPLLAWVLLILLAAIWGGSFMLTNVAVRELPPLTVVALRLCLATGLVWAYATARGARLPNLRVADGRRIGKFALGAAIVGNVLPFSLISWAQLYIPSALSGLLMAPMPLMVLMLSHFLIAGERLTTPRVIGFIIGFAGVAILIGGEAIAQLGRGDALALVGQVATLAAAFGYACSSIILKRANPPDPLGISIMILGIGAMITLPAALMVESPDLTAASWLTIACVIGLGVGATGLAQVLLMKIIGLAGPPFLSLVNYQVPVWAVIFGVLLLGETLPGAFWPALALILIGLAIAQFIGQRRTPHV